MFLHVINQLILSYIRSFNNDDYYSLFSFFLWLKPIGQEIFTFSYSIDRLMRVPLSRLNLLQSLLGFMTLSFFFTLCPSPPLIVLHLYIRPYHSVLFQQNWANWINRYLWFKTIFTLVGWLVYVHSLILLLAFNSISSLNLTTRGSFCSVVLSKEF